MICGAEDLIRVCREKIAPQPHTLSADGRFSWEEVECLGACANAPMAQIGKDFYEDLTADKLAELIDAMAAGQVPRPGPQDGRFSSEAKTGQNALTNLLPPVEAANASVTLALEIGDTLKRIDGTEVPILTPWLGKTARAEVAQEEKIIVADTADAAAFALATGTKPVGLTAARDGKPDDLKEIVGVGPKLEELLHELGIYHFDQIADWSSDQIAWVDANLEGFHGRVTRDEWVKQAQQFVKERKGTAS